MSDWTPTARTMVASGADAIRYSSSAVFPIPASPRSTSDWLSPRRIVATNSSSSAHSLPRPRRLARPVGWRERPAIVHDPKRHEPHVVDFKCHAAVSRSRCSPTASTEPPGSKIVRPPCRCRSRAATGPGISRTPRPRLAIREVQLTPDLVDVLQAHLLRAAAAGYPTGPEGYL